MARYLVWRLWGPLQAYGDIAVDKVREEQGRPTKSAVIGMAAAALGIDREDDAAFLDLHKKLETSFRVLHQGFVRRDYHTTQTPSGTTKPHWCTRRDELGEENRNTILSTRKYREDALYDVGLTSSDEGLLDRLEQGFYKPTYIPYLGRRSCASGLPIIPQRFEAAHPVAAFEAYYEWFQSHFKDVEGWKHWAFAKENQDQYVYTESTEGLDAFESLELRDALVSNQLRTFTTRQEFRGIMHKRPKKEDEHLSPPHLLT